MNDILQGFILGLTQGLTEFLPVSSSGHLLLLEHFGIGEENLFLNLALHVATLLSLCLVLRKEIFAVIKHPLGEEMRFIILSAVPTAVLALVIRLYCPMEAEFLPFFFIATSVVLLLPYIVKPQERLFVGKNCIKTAVITGLAQGVACFSGLSRSGTTTATLNLCGVNREDSAKLSFLMSIPVILGSTVVETASGGAQGVNVPMLIVGAVTAFAVGILAIKLFVKIVIKGKLWIFSIYTFLLGIATFLIMALT